MPEKLQAISLDLAIATGLAEEASDHEVSPGSPQLVRQDSSSRVCGFFPGSKGNRAIVDSLLAPVLPKLGITAPNTLFAHSTCPDEINHGKYEITTVLADYFGEMFLMGGLAGVPFTGQTGFGAFSNHVPNKGNLFILFAPHVSVPHAGVVGSTRRVDQSNDTAACGANIGAYDAVKKLVEERGADATIKLSDEDYQMDWIKREILAQWPRITSTKRNVQVEVAHVMYEVIERQIRKIVSMDWTQSLSPTGRLILFGGIQINTDTDQSDMFLPMLFESWQRDAQDPSKIVKSDLFPLESTP